MLAGKAATEIVFGETDVGAVSDLSRAFNIVDRFIDTYCTYGFDVFESRNSSNDLIARKEKLKAVEMERFYLQAKKILIENRKFLDELAKSLIEKCILRAKEIQEIKNATTI